ncbi:MAG: ATP synthase F1 subunit gamma [Melioribacteraceae bacterium]|nr:ATP synthase F1 subunit gamma [Melioribacteraceae bacterium]
MATLRDIKRRITGVSNTQQITKAMKMVAAAKLRRAQDNIINAKPYSRKISEVLSNLLAMEKSIDNPLLEERLPKNVAIIIVTSDSGLCGAFNMTIIRTVEDMIKNEFEEQYKNNSLSLYCVGKKGTEYFSRRNHNILDKKIDIMKKLQFSDASEILDNLTAKFLNKELDKVVVVFNEFKSVMQQKLSVQQLLPIVPRIEDIAESSGTSSEFIYEPDKLSIINALIPKFLNSQLWRILLDSYAAELGARMTAMDLATENAGELISSLKVQYNKERQASITTEILEIVSGAEALKKG